MLGPVSFAQGIAHWDRRSRSLRAIGMLVSIALLPSSRAAAEETAQFVAVSAGVGFSLPYDERDPSGAGGWAAGEYVLALSPWFSPRAYAGLTLTFPDRDFCRGSGVDCDVSAKIGFLGGKGRFTIPIPYVAPFLELGIGASFGVIHTRTLETDEHMEGMTYHVPIALGLSLGENHGVDVGFSYLFHPSVRHANGAVAIGLAFPLE